MAIWRTGSREQQQRVGIWAKPKMCSCVRGARTCPTARTSTRALASVHHRRQARAATRAAASSGNGVALIDLLNHVAAGTIPPSDAAQQIKALGDEASSSRANFPEVVWGKGKTAEQIAADIGRVATRQGVVLATLVDADVAVMVQQLLPEAQIKDKARMVVYKSPTVRQEKLPGAVAMVTAGSANEAVVEECRVMLQSLGCYCFTLGQAGIMGMHRMVQNIEAVRAADVVVVITGSDASMVSMVAGMVDIPVIALPTSSGYGTAFAGVAPLLGSLNSSAPGVTSVNIDSGCGASMAAWRILKNAAKFRRVAAAGN